MHYHILLLFSGDFLYIYRTFWYCLLRRESIDDKELTTRAGQNPSYLYLQSTPISVPYLVGNSRLISP